MLANYRLQLAARLILAERPQLKRSVSQTFIGERNGNEMGRPVFNR
jgi:hypothetical protein